VFFILNTLLSNAYEGHYICFFSADPFCIRHMHFRDTFWCDFLVLLVATKLCPSPSVNPVLTKTTEELNPSSYYAVVRSLLVNSLTY